MSRWPRCLPVPEPAEPPVSRGQAWGGAAIRRQRATTTPGRHGARISLNFDREYVGGKGEPWRRNFVSDLATAFATPALLQVGASVSATGITTALSP